MARVRYLDGLLYFLLFSYWGCLVCTLLIFKGIQKAMKLYFVILFFLFPLRRTILKCEKKIFLCYQDQKKWIKGKFCQPEAEGRGLVMFPRFTFSDRDNIGNVFEHFKIDLSSGWNRKNNITECFFAFILTFLRWLGKKAWQKSYKN